ncbi:MAG TPA: cytochrome c [Rhodanobacteraceae bacterium]|nr:cytochrome c [Rhodanobacteraceae bacterium]
MNQSTPPPTSQRSPLLIALICLLVGAMAGAVIANSVNQRIAAEHAWTRGVMHLLATHSGALGKAVKAGQCGDSHHHLDQLAAIEQDVIPAFSAAQLGPDFESAANKLRDAIAAARQAAPSTCAALSTAIKPVGEACKNCHMQFR